jgi:hypothetical protein
VVSRTPGRKLNDLFADPILSAHVKKFIQEVDL